MTSAEWESLNPGDIVSNNEDTNWRVVLGAKGGYIVLPMLKPRYARSTTAYGRGDKHLFKKTPFKIKLRTISWTISTTTVPDVTRS